MAWLELGVATYSHGRTTLEGLWLFPAIATTDFGTSSPVAPCYTSGHMPHPQLLLTPEAAPHTCNLFSHPGLCTTAIPHFVVSLHTGLVAMCHTVAMRRP